MPLIRSTLSLRSREACCPASQRVSGPPLRRAGIRRVGILDRAIGSEERAPYAKD